MNDASKRAGMRLKPAGYRQYEYLAKATRFLAACRQRAAFGGLWDVADLHWWWRDGGYEDPDRQLFFESEEGFTLGIVLLSERYETFDYEIFPGFEQTDIGASIFLSGLSWLKKRLDSSADPAAASFFVRDSHAALRRLADAQGFRASGQSYIQTACALSEHPAKAPPPPTYRVRQIQEADLLDGGPPVLKTSREKFSRVREAPMYRPEHHLVAADGNDRAVAECIYWVDETSRIGVFEPVETRAEYRRLGLGKALLAEGMRRMAAAGVRLAKVSHYNGNLPAGALYESAGFQRRFERVVYVPSTGR